MPHDIITCEHDGVFTITINRLDKKNALNSHMYKQLCEHFKYANKAASVRCLVIQGSENCFTAGNDYHDFISAKGENELPAFDFIRELAKFNKPLIAAVAGVAVGIGATLLLHCDMVFCSENTSIIMPFTQLGICLEAGASLLLPLKVGSNRAFEIAVLGNVVNDKQALEFGLVNKICNSSQLIDYVAAQAEKIAALPSDAVLTSKRLMKEIYQNQLNNAIENEIVEIKRLLTTDECQTIMNNFNKT